MGRRFPCLHRMEGGRSGRVVRSAAGDSGTVRSAAGGSSNGARTGIAFSRRARSARRAPLPLPLSPRHEVHGTRPGAEHLAQHDAHRQHRQHAHHGHRDGRALGDHRQKRAQRAQKRDGVEPDAAEIADAPGREVPCGHHREHRQHDEEPQPSAVELLHLPHASTSSAGRTTMARSVAPAEIDPADSEMHAHSHAPHPLHASTSTTGTLSAPSSSAS